MLKKVGECMEIGASSSCFYPLETEKAFLQIAKLGFKTSEIFFNSPSELEKPFLKELKNIKDGYGINVVSLHPMRSFSEGYDIFSKYERRFTDAVESYSKYFEAAAELGAEFIVLHGSRGRSEITPQQYAERFGKLSEVAKNLGCTLTHENVVDYAGAKPEFMKFMKAQLGDSFKMVLDIKQARRAKVDYREFIELMGENIVHVHLSDFSKEKDCIPPIEDGLFDFGELFTLMKKADYKGKYIVELYSDGFSKGSEIMDSAVYLQNILNKVMEGSV